MFRYRNPGGTQPGPWCFVDIVINQSVEKVIETCDIPRCSDKMWLFVIAPFISLVLLLMITVSIVCCRKFRKNDSRDGISNIHNVRHMITIDSCNFSKSKTSNILHPLHRSMYPALAKISMAILV